METALRGQEMNEPITTAVLNYGAPGLIIVVLLMAVKHLYNRNCEIQEKRISEGREQIQISGKLSSAFERLSELVKDSLEKSR